MANNNNNLGERIAQKASNTAVAKHVCRCAIACAEQTTMDGARPIDVTNGAADSCRQVVVRLGHHHAGAAIGAAVLTSAEHGANRTAEHLHLSESGGGVGYRHIARFYHRLHISIFYRTG